MGTGSSCEDRAHGPSLGKIYGAACAHAPSQTLSENKLLFDNRVPQFLAFHLPQIVTKFAQTFAKFVNNELLDGAVFFLCFGVVHLQRH
jgi:hypothetical protein